MCPCWPTKRLRGYTFLALVKKCHFYSHHITISSCSFYSSLNKVSFTNLID